MRALREFLETDGGTGRIGDAAFWLYLLHLVSCLAIAQTALGFETTAVSRKPLSLWPGTRLLLDWWLAYGALLATMLAPLFVIFVFVLKRSDNWRRAIACRFPEPGFWAAIRSHGLGLALLFLLSFAPLSVNRWLVDYLYQLPERGFAATVVGEVEHQPVPIVITGAQHRRLVCNDLDLPADKLPKECFLPPDSPEAKRGLFSATIHAGPYVPETTVFLFHLHFALMIVLYFGLCRRLSRTTPRPHSRHTPSGSTCA